jgi:MtN3 and saliva related transmembrane protein
MDLTTGGRVTGRPLHTISYAPQTKKCWDTGRSGDLSIGMFLTLSSGVALWVMYGLLINDYVVIVANVVSLLLLLSIL